MGKSLYISTTESGSGKALVALGIINLILRKTTKVSFFRPVIQTGQPMAQTVEPSGDCPAEKDEDIDLILQHFGLPQSYEASFGLSADQVNELMGQHQIDHVIAIILDKFKALENQSDMKSG